MNRSIQLQSVNIGHSRKLEVGYKTIETGIFKDPVNKRIVVNETGLSDDMIGNSFHHGGKDQAVYIYSAEDYQWWNGQLNREITPGTFGENLTFSSFPVPDLKIGDRFQINSVLLEITAPRIPCATFAARMEDRDFVKKFRDARRPGVYARVLQNGELQAGNDVTFIPSMENYPAIVDLFELWYAKDRDEDLLQQILESPLAERFQKVVKKWLDESVS